MGTPDYISREQIRDQRGDVRSDVYSLGVILYEILTGQVPFRGPTPLAATNHRLLSDPESAQFDSEITPQIQEILRRALQRAPRLRHPRAQHFARDLKHPEQVAVPESASQRDWQTNHTPKSHGALLLVLLGLIPVVIFALLLVVAHQK